MPDQYYQPVPINADTYGADHIDTFLELPLCESHHEAREAITALLDAVGWSPGPWLGVQYRDGDPTQPIPPFGIVEWTASPPKPYMPARPQIPGQLDIDGHEFTKAPK